MSDPRANTLWAGAFVDELARAGVREVVVAPGSRSTPLVMAFAVDDRFRTRVHIDERSAAFFALGVGRGSGNPAVVVTTSGTAVANVFPAVVEAAQGGVPLLVLSADRPHRLRDSDANQAIYQVGIFGSFVRSFFDVAPPTVEGSALRYLRALAGRAYASAVGPNAGPVHLNFPFDTPLEPVEAPDLEAVDSLGVNGRASGAPYTRITVGSPTLTSSQLEEISGLIRTDRGVIVAGPTQDAIRLAPATKALAAATGFPILADPLSGVRYGPSGDALVVAGYDLFLRDEAVREYLAPSVIVRVGVSPTSSALQQWLIEQDRVPHVVIDGSGRWKDHGATATHYLHADPSTTLMRMAEVCSTGPASADVRESAWRMAWWVAASSTLSAIREYVGNGGEPHEGDVLASVLDAMPSGGNLFVSNSMPIRDLDAFGHPSEDLVHVFANRGASGIDGIVSSAFGVASQREAPTVCVVGDVAFFHDQNGLLWSREEDAAVVFILIDNDGGGIFHALPISGLEPHFTRLFATPHGTDPKHAAAAQGLDFREVPVPGVAVAMTRAISEGRTQIVYVRTNREQNHRRHVEVCEAVAHTVREALGSVTSINPNSGQR